MRSDDVPEPVDRPIVRTRPSQRVDTDEGLEARDRASRNAVCDDAVVAGILGGDKSKLAEARQQIAAFGSEAAGSAFGSHRSPAEDYREHVRRVREERRRHPSFARAMDAEQAAYQERRRLPETRRPRRAPGGLVALPSTRRLRRLSEIS